LLLRRNGNWHLLQCRESTVLSSPLACGEQELTLSYKRNNNICYLQTFLYMCVFVTETSLRIVDDGNKVATY